MVGERFGTRTREVIQRMIDAAEPNQPGVAAAWRKIAVAANEMRAADREQDEPS
jgi:hypothetical protein